MVEDNRVQTQLSELTPFDRAHIPMGELTAQHMKTLVYDMLQGAYDTDQVTEMLTRLSPKALSAEQLAGCVDGIIDSAAYTVEVDKLDKPVIVPVGTGGDSRNGHSTVNITTMAGFVMAASGECKVALYGNRRSSGKFGKMDLLEGVGIPIVLTEEQIRNQLEEHGIAPVFAQTAYPGARHVSQARREIQGPTLFNIAFPIAAPVVGKDVRMLIGSAQEETLRSMADISKSRGVQRSMFVRDTHYGMDEVSLETTKFVVIGKQGIEDKLVDVGDLLGEKASAIEDLEAEVPEEFVEVFRQVMDPSYTSSRIESVRRVVAANAACGLYLANEHENGFENHFVRYYAQALDLLRSGAAFRKVGELISS